MRALWLTHLTVLALLARNMEPAACRAAKGLFRAFLRRRRLLGWRRIGFLLQILGRLLLRGLQILNDLLQGSKARLQRFNLAVGGIKFLLMVPSQLRNRLLQEVDVALQAARAALHRLFDRADLDAGNILRMHRVREWKKRKPRRNAKSDSVGDGNLHSIILSDIADHGKLRGADRGLRAYHIETSIAR